MTSLVNSSVTLIIVGRITAWKTSSKVNASVEDLVCGRRARKREVAESQEASTKIGEEVEVKVAVGTLTESLLHLTFGRTALGGGGPGIVDGDVDSLGVEGDAETVKREERLV